jgi:outer membrane protein assembly factor BamA
MTLLLLVLNLVSISGTPAGTYPGTQSDSLFVSKVIIRGNVRTKDAIILREMTFSPGMTLTASRLEHEVERSRRNVFNTQLFISVDADYDVVGSEAAVMIEVKERLYVLPLPIIDLADRSFNEWWYTRNRDLKRLIYGIQLNHSNLTGNSDILKVKAYGGFIPYFELSYSRPYIDRRQRMGIRGGVFFSAQKSFSYRTWNDRQDFIESETRTLSRKGAYLEYNLRNALYNFNTLYLGFTQTTIADTIPGMNPDYLGAAGIHLPFLTLAYDYRYDKRDNRQYALEGTLFKVGLRYNRPFNPGVRDHARVNVSYQKFFPISGKFYGSITGKAQVSLPQRQLYPFIAGLGFNKNYIRGYELNVIDGQHYLVSQSDLKYQLFNRTLDITSFLKLRQFNTVPVGCYFTAFFDIGSVRNYYPELSNSALSNRLLYGGGFGFDIVTFYDTSVKINYSINQFGFGKLYFGVFRD